MTLIIVMLSGLHFHNPSGWWLAIGRENEKSRPVSGKGKKFEIDFGRDEEGKYWEMDISARY